MNSCIHSGNVTYWHQKQKFHFIRKRNISNGVLLSDMHLWSCRNNVTLYQSNINVSLAWAISPGWPSSPYIPLLQPKSKLKKDKGLELDTAYPTLLSHDSQGSCDTSAPQRSNWRLVAENYGFDTLKSHEGKFFNYHESEIGKLPIQLCLKHSSVHFGNQGLFCQISWNFGCRAHFPKKS